MREDDRVQKEIRTEQLSYASLQRLQQHKEHRLQAFSSKQLSRIIGSRAFQAGSREQGENGLFGKAKRGRSSREAEVDDLECQ